VILFSSDKVVSIVLVLTGPFFRYRSPNPQAARTSNWLFFC